MEKESSNKTIHEQDNNENPLINLISELQNKLFDSNINTNTIKDNDINKADNYSDNNDVNNKGNNISDLLEFVKKMGALNTIDSIENNSKNISSNLDIGNIMNFQNLFSQINTNNEPSKNLLNSLKPFMRETRRKNIDTYINLLGVARAFNIFKKGSEK